MMNFYANFDIVLMPSSIKHGNKNFWQITSWLAQDLDPKYEETHWHDCPSVCDVIVYDSLLNLTCEHLPAKGAGVFPKLIHIIKSQWNYLMFPEFYIDIKLIIDQTLQEEGRLTRSNDPDFSTIKISISKFILIRLRFCRALHQGIKDRCWQTQETLRILTISGYWKETSPNNYRFSKNNLTVVKII